MQTRKYYSFIVLSFKFPLLIYVLKFLLYWPVETESLFAAQTSKRKSAILADEVLETYSALLFTRWSNNMYAADELYYTGEDSFSKRWFTSTLNQKSKYLNITKPLT